MNDVYLGNILIPFRTGLEHGAGQGSRLLYPSPSYTNHSLDNATSATQDNIMTLPLNFETTASSPLNMELDELSASSMNFPTQTEDVRLPKRRRQDEESREPLSDSGNVCLIDAYSKLAQVLSGLRAVAARGKSSHTTQNNGRVEQAFPFVSTLCDIMKGAQLRSLMDSPKGLISPCILLASTIIAMVVETYHEQSDRIHLQNFHFGIAEPSTQHQAQCRTEATVMDLHLSKLELIVQDLGSIEHEAHITDLLADTRRLLREYLEDW